MKKVSVIAFFTLFSVLLSFSIFLDTGMARVFAVFGPETFSRSTTGPVSEVRYFPVQYPEDADFTLHLFYFGIKKDLDGIVPSAVVVLNGKEVVGPNELSRKIHYIRKKVTLSEGNRLSVELRGKPGDGIRVVITGSNNEPQQFDYREIIQPDGSSLLGLNLIYEWSFLEQPENSKPVLSDPSSPTPSLRVDLPGDYLLQLRIQGDLWESDPILVRLAATDMLTAITYDPFVPVPVKSRVVTGGSKYGDYSIQVGSITYTAPAPNNCGSPTNDGFQVLVLDRASLEKKDHRTFNVPCGNTEMLNFLNTLDNTKLVIVSSLGSVEPSSVCEMSPSCPIAAKLKEFGGSNVFPSHYTTTLAYTMVDCTYCTIQFSYSLIGIRGLGENQGYELNDWDHKVFVQADLWRQYSNISGYFVTDVNYPHNRTFVYPEYVEIKTREQTAAQSNTIKIGDVTYPSQPLQYSNPYYVGGFQVLVLDRDTLKPASIAEPNKTFWTGFTINYWYGVDDGLNAMYSYLSSIINTIDNKKYIVVIVSFGSPISTFNATEDNQPFTNLVKVIGNYYGGTLGVLNKIAANPTYSLIGMSSATAQPFGAQDVVEASSSGVNLRAVMHKDKQGWFKPVTTAEGAVGAIEGPDFSLLSVALQDPTPWPMTDPSDPMYSQYDAAYKYISSHLGVTTCPPENPGCVTDVRSRYNYNTVPSTSTCQAITYAANPNFSENTFNAMKLQLCGGVDQNGNYVNGEFQYVQAVETFASDLDTLLIYLQLGETADMLNTYNAVKAKVNPPDQSNVLYDTGIIIRGFLTAGTSLVTHPAIKGIMGIINGAMSIAMGISKKPSGEDDSALTTTAINLVNEMDNLWKNCNIGKEIALGMIKTDWGKLQYVGTKLLGEWSYSDLDKKDWEIIARNALQAYYFQSLIPVRWKIDYVLNTSIKAPKDYLYHALSGSPEHQHTDYCHPYCEGSTANPSALWVDQFLDGRYSWYVLEDKIVQDNPTLNKCGRVHFDYSADLRDVLFGSGDWCDSNGCHGQKLNLSKPIFYERWLPKEIYGDPMSRVPTGGTFGVYGGYNETCND